MKDRLGKLKKKITEMPAKAQEKWTKFEDKSYEMLDKWENKSRDFIHGFLRMFSRDGAIVRCREKRLYLFLSKFLCSLVWNSKEWQRVCSRCF